MRKKIERVHETMEEGDGPGEITDRETEEEGERETRDGHRRGSAKIGNDRYTGDSKQRSDTDTRRKEQEQGRAVVGAERSEYKAAFVPEF